MPDHTCVKDEAYEMAYLDYLNANETLVNSLHPEFSGDIANCSQNYLVSVISLLREARNAHSRGSPMFLPYELYDLLIATLDHAAGSSEPWIVTSAKRRGARRDSQSVLESKKFAVLYAEAARQGHIRDRKPRKSVCEMYGISPETYKGWRKRFQISSGEIAVHYAGKSNDIGERTQGFHFHLKRLGKHYKICGAGDYNQMNQAKIE